MKDSDLHVFCVASSKVSVDSLPLRIGRKYTGVPDLPEMRTWMILVVYYTMKENEIYGDIGRIQM